MRGQGTKIPQAAHDRQEKQTTVAGEFNTRHVVLELIVRKPAQIREKPEQHRQPFSSKGHLYPNQNQQNTHCSSAPEQSPRKTAF